MNPMTVADVLAHGILATGARTLFALAGATYAPLLMAFEDGGGRIIGGRHESGTVGAADGYARRTGRLGFACIISEQGLANALTAIMTASQAGTPIVVIATRFPDSWIEPSASFTVDRHELTAPSMKFSRTLPSAERVGEYFQAACKAALEGAPGPALLVIPMDMMTRPIPGRPVAVQVPVALPPAAGDQIERAVAAIASSQRPVVIVDEGAVWGGAEAGVNALARLGIAVLGNGLGRGLVGETAPAGYPWPYAQSAVALADLVIVIGAKMTMWFGYGKAPRFAASARFIHIDSDASSVGRNVPVSIAIVAHIGGTIDAIARALEQSGFRSDAAWLVEALADRTVRVESFVNREDGPMHQIEIGSALDKALPDDRIVVCDGADILNFTFAKLRVKRPRSYADHLPFGAMGMGLPLAIGMAAGEAELAMARGERAAPTVYVTGDGSIGFFLAELDTLRRAGLFLIALVSNDSKWGTEYHGQNLAYGRTSNTELGETDYASIARAFGCRGETVHERAQLDTAIEAALAHGSASVVDVRVDPMGGAIRKTDPLLGMIIFEEITKEA